MNILWIENFQLIGNIYFFESDNTISSKHRWFFYFVTNERSFHFISVLSYFEVSGFLISILSISYSYCVTSYFCNQRRFLCNFLENDWIKFNICGFLRFERVHSVCKCSQSILCRKKLYQRTNTMKIEKIVIHWNHNDYSFTNL